MPFFEPGLPELLSKHVASGALRFMTSMAKAATFGDLHFVCVGTPQKKGEFAADISFVDSPFTELLSRVRPGVVLVGKSTVAAGTAARLAQPVEQAGCELVWNPEFLREGFAVEDTLTPDRVLRRAVSGETDRRGRCATQRERTLPTWG